MFISTMVSTDSSPIPSVRFYSPPLSNRPRRLRIFSLCVTHPAPPPPPRTPFLSETRAEYRYPRRAVWHPRELGSTLAGLGSALALALLIGRLPFDGVPLEGMGGGHTCLGRFGQTPSPGFHY